MRISDWSSDVCSSDLLVENQHLRIVQDRLGQADATLEALGQRLDGLPQHVLQLHLGDRGFDPLALVRTTEAADFSDELEKTAHRHVAVAGRAFGQITDLPLGLQGLGANRSEEHTSELQSLMRISYAVFC